MADEPKKTRVFRVAKDAKAAIVLNENNLALVADNNHFIGMNEFGTAIKGPVSFIADTMSRRHAGLFVGLFDMLEMIPQTVFTPFPSRFPMPPVNTVLAIGATVGFVAGGMAA